MSLADPSDDALVLAHEQDDVRIIAQAYLSAADAAEAEGDVDRACFFLTHAWIFALEAGDALADGLQERLKGHQRV